VTVVERKKAWEKLATVLDRVHAKMPPSKKDPKAEEEEIARQIKAFRKHRA
jgi:hypothetical protein